jgi:predicted HAD superfamily Cof-like phosphohydrolase|tara:strand:+ start:4321 stop:4713 length:393 start_codon:yes stop_codon:yes gene_type:complete
MIKKPIAAVTKFHKAYEIGIEYAPTANIPKNITELRFNLMKEENEEYLQAAKDEDLVEIGDALGDMLYILCGTIIAHGFQDKMEAIFDEIQRSNMSKLGADKKPIYREDGKVMKGPNYFRPDLERILLRD